MLERLNQEIKRRTHVIRIFPKKESALRLIRGCAVEIHEDLIEAHRDLNTATLREEFANNSSCWRPPKVNAAASSQSGCSGLAPAPELCPSGAPAAATSPPAFMNKPPPFPNSYLTPFLLNLTHTTRPAGSRVRRGTPNTTGEDEYAPQK